MSEERKSDEQRRWEIFLALIQAPGNATDAYSIAALAAMLLEGFQNHEARLRGGRQYYPPSPTPKP